MKGYYNKEGTLTVCDECVILEQFDDVTWIRFPSHFEPDNCTECGEGIE